MKPIQNSSRISEFPSMAHEENMVSPPMKRDRSVVQFAYWGKVGAITGGLWGLFLGTLLFVSPGVGSWAAITAATIVVALEGAVVLSVLNMSWVIDRQKSRDRSPLLASSILVPLSSRKVPQINVGVLRMDVHG